ncbi:hypothetical protein [Lysinibacter cavernae]|uniref:Uncharacterized protein n=1 Tax=Lysinibacter cavernae TaxID=1640652 RepID=A0A7X5R3D9_9MICO|nr:hypothetical protein [Lysinibacter cavernae]NIH54918.1 hypothetical protein [Lysinibacter cavernae]
MTVVGGSVVNAKTQEFLREGQHDLERRLMEIGGELSPAAEGWLAVAGGSFAIALCLLCMFRSAKVARWLANAQRSRGGTMAEQAAQNSTPGTIMFVGIAGLFVGTPLLIVGIVQLSQLQG